MKKSKILVVDDVATIRKWAELVLQKAGFEVTTTDNPVLVPSMIFRGGFDLVLLDVSMPLLNGDQVAAIMKDAPVSSKVVLFSSLPAEELQVLVGECGASGYIRKTSSGDTLLSQIAPYLQGS